MLGVYIIAAALVPLLIVFIVLDRTLFWTKLPRHHRGLARASACDDVVLKAEGARDAVLMLHESGGTPGAMSHAGAILRDAGFDVYIPALPGSAETVDEVKTLSTPPHPGPWISLATERLLELKARYRKVFLYGGSYGGSVALLLAQRHAVDGVAAVSAPVGLYNRDFRKRFSRNAMVFLSPLISLFAPRIRAGVSRKEALELEGMGVAEGVVHTRAVHAQKVWLRVIRAGLRKVTAPVLVMHAQGDRTVDYRNARRIMEGVSSRVREHFDVDLSHDHLTRRHRLSTHMHTRDAVAERAAKFFIKIAMES